MRQEKLLITQFFLNIIKRLYKMHALREINSSFYSEKRNNQIILYNYIIKLKKIRDFRNPFQLCGAVRFRILTFLRHALTGRKYTLSD